jgi:hypothetical protein
MRSGLLLVTTLLVGACGANRPLATSFAGTSPTPAPDAFTCVREQLKALGYTQTSYDTDHLRVAVRRYDENARRPDTQFRRMVHRIEADVDPGSGGAITAITITAKTFAEYTTQRGPTEVQELTDPQLQKDAQTVLNRCGAPKP